MMDISRGGWATVCAAALVGMAMPGHAAACVPGSDGGTPTVTCDAPQVTPLSSDVDATRVTVTASGSVVVPAADAMDLRGDGQTLINFGRIEGGGESNAVRARGTGLTVENAGTVVGADRGIRLSGGDGDFTLRNLADGVISARRQAIRLDNELVLGNTLIENHGLIESAEGRAIQSRGPGNTVINHGTLRGGEEVVEGRIDFDITNHGLIALNGLAWDAGIRTWTDTGATVDEDGIQFSSGTVNNFGVILATDDGVDLDQGRVHNHATGVIVSAGDDSIRSSAAVDIDEVLQIPLPGGAERFEVPGRVTILNEGHMEGPRAVAADLEAVQEIEIVNTGTMIGRSGFAIDLAPGQGDTSIALSGRSVVIGDILFGGGGLNTLVLGPFEDGAAFGGSVAARGGTPEDIVAGAGTPYGFDVEFGDMVGLGDFRSFWQAGERFTLNLAAGGGTIGFNLFGVEDFRFGGTSYTSEGFAAFLAGEGVNVIPLPAAGWLLLGGLGTLVVLRRRRRAA